VKISDQSFDIATGVFWGGLILTITLVGGKLVLGLAVELILAVLP